MKGHDLIYRSFGENGVLIEWPKMINSSILKDIIGFEQNINCQMGEVIIETVVAYNSLTIFINLNKASKDEIIDVCQRLYLSQKESDKMEITAWQIPVCYDQTFGIDLNEMSDGLNMSTEEIIQIHTSTTYKVFFIGFLPGFMYLGGLNERINYPRRAQPRTKIRKGDVAIGGQQTGIYPKECPAGWNVIGNTPIGLFDPGSDPPCFIKPGDSIRFQQVSKEEFDYIELEIDTNKFNLNSLKING